MRIDMTVILDWDNLAANPNVVIIIGICVTAVFLAIYRSYYRPYYRPPTTKLKGPPSKDFGVSKELYNTSTLVAYTGTGRGPTDQCTSYLGPYDPRSSFCKIPGRAHICI